MRRSADLAAAATRSLTFRLFSLISATVLAVAALASGVGRAAVSLMVSAEQLLSMLVRILVVFVTGIDRFVGFLMQVLTHAATGVVQAVGALSSIANLAPRGSASGGLTVDPLMVLVLVILATAVLHARYPRFLEYANDVLAIPLGIAGLFGLPRLIRRSRNHVSRRGDSSDREK